MLDIFSTNNQQPTTLFDLFGEYNKYDKFFWSVGVFSSNGATEAIKYAIDAQLETFFPYQLNEKSNYVPLWRNYLFIEYISPLTMMVCRQSKKFLGFIKFGDQPELAHRDAINEVLKLLRVGKYNYFTMPRQYIKRGTIVQIIDDINFGGKYAKVLCDITPDINKNHRVPVELGRWKLMIEIKKLQI